MQIDFLHGAFLLSEILYPTSFLHHAPKSPHNKKVTSQAQKKVLPVKGTLTDNLSDEAVQVFWGLMNAANDEHTKSMVRNIMRKMESK